MSTPVVTQRQREILRALTRADRPVTIQELAEDLGRHATTVRSQLQQLQAGGLVRSVPVRDGARGRPRLVWFTVRTQDASLADMAVVLAESLAAKEEDPAGVAYELGRRMAHGTVESPEELALEMTRRGFDASLDGSGAGTILLHACPYRRAQSVLPSVVCPMHEGLTDALLADSTRLGDHRSRLEPHVAPGVCRLSLVRRETDGARPTI